MQNKELKDWKWLHIEESRSFSRCHGVPEFMWRWLHRKWENWVFLFSHSFTHSPTIERLTSHNLRDEKWRRKGRGSWFWLLLPGVCKRVRVWKQSEWEWWQYRGEEGGGRNKCERRRRISMNLLVLGDRAPSHACIIYWLTCECVWVTRSSRD